MTDRENLKNGDTSKPTFKENSEDEGGGQWKRQHCRLIRKQKRVIFTRISADVRKGDLK